MVFILAICHFSLLVASHVKTTACANSISWRLIMVFNLVLSLGLIGLAIYLTVVETDDCPAWFLWLEGILSGLFFLFEGMRTYKFEKTTHVEETEETEEQSAQ